MTKKNPVKHRAGSTENRRRRKRKASTEELLAIGHRCAGTLKGAPISHGEMLYASSARTTESGITTGTASKALKTKRPATSRTFRPNTSGKE